jgi:hypothetical protein
MFFSSRKLFGFCFYLCISPSMLYRICHKLQEHKHVCEIHGESLINVPFGVLLSRGLDSFLMLAMAHNISTTLKLPMYGVPNFTFFLLASRWW